jgi:hypothetical protein
MAGAAKLGGDETPANELQGRSDRIRFQRPKSSRKVDDKIHGDYDLAKWDM